jgi:hypothetical protein
MYTLENTIKRKGEFLFFSSSFIRIDRIDGIFITLREGTSKELVELDPPVSTKYFVHKRFNEKEVNFYNDDESLFSLIDQRDYFADLIKDKFFDWWVSFNINIVSAGKTYKVPGVFGQENSIDSFNIIELENEIRDKVHNLIFGTDKEFIKP